MLFASKKHNLAILRALLIAASGLGFNAILRQVPGATPRILSVRLKELEKLKLVQKSLVLGDRQRVEYMALPRSDGLRKPIRDLVDWGSKELP